MAAPDFYFAINATFRFLYLRWGEAGLRRYWRAMGREYYAPLARRFQAGGLNEVAAYWRDSFNGEPGADVTVDRGEGEVRVDVRVCPALRHLRLHQREVMPLYCEHCRDVSTAIAEEAGLLFRLEGGGGACRQVFRADESP